MRRVFYSFHYERDVFRVQLVRKIHKIGVFEHDELVQPCPWEEVRCKSSNAIKQWISQTMAQCSCVVVLIGRETATRPWVNYEIKKGWNDAKGLLGIYINNLPSMENKHDLKGESPMLNFELQNDTHDNLNSIVPIKENKTYADIRYNLADWVEEAIKIRQNYQNILCRELA